MLKVKLLTAAAAAALVLPSIPAAAAPTTPLTYPAGSTATRFTGLAFDTCTAPPLTAMTAWKASPYKGSGCTSAASTGRVPSRS
ncbi:hypothetical protein ACXJJ3_34335 [Kribbella sp. WER1]